MARFNIRAVNVNMLLKAIQMMRSINPVHVYARSFSCSFWFDDALVFHLFEKTSLHKQEQEQASTSNSKPHVLESCGQLTPGEQCHANDGRAEHVYICPMLKNYNSIVMVTLQTTKVLSTRP